MQKGLTSHSKQEKRIFVLLLLVGNRTVPFSPRAVLAGILIFSFVLRLPFLTVPLDSDAGLFAAIGRLMSDERLRRAWGTAGRAYVEKEYSLRRWLPVLLGLLDLVADLPGPGSVRA